MKKETAILVALLGNPHMYHGSYIEEKLISVLEHGATESILDSQNMARFRKLMER